MWLLAMNKKIRKKQIIVSIYGKRAVATLTNKSGADSTSNTEICTCGHKRNSKTSAYQPLLRHNLFKAKGVSYYV